MARKKRVEGRWIADLLSVYSICPDRLSYLDIVRLDLNLERVRHAHAVATAVGTQAAMSNDPLPVIWADAVARSPEQAEELIWEANVARADARRRAKGRCS